MKAREYFENIRAEVRDCEHERARLERKRCTEDLRPTQRDVAAGHTYGGCMLDSMGRVDDRLDAEADLRRHRASLNAELDEASAVLYGQSSRGGVAKGMGSLYADIVCMVYLQGEPWPVVAARLSLSVGWCRELANQAFDFVDEFGFAALKES